MLATLFEAALRSLSLGLVVWLALRIFRIHSVVAQRSAWSAVLAGSLLMPFALPFTSQWHLPSFANIPVPGSLKHLQPLFRPTPPAPSRSSAQSGDLARSRGHRLIGAQNSAMRPATHASVVTGSAAPDRLPEPNALPSVSLRQRLPGIVQQISIARVAVLGYFVVASVLLLRLLLGLVSSMRLWHTSTPIPPVTDVPFGADLNLRWSRKISAPVTVASGIVLPAGYKSWPQEKIRIVLAHERSHVRQHDFHLQFLASVYAAIAWFSPLGWWLKHKLSDLGETISDSSGLLEAPNRSAYAQILLEFAAAPRPTLIGVAMARSSSTSRRIERVLNDTALRHAFTGDRRVRAAVSLASVAFFAIMALVRVQAASGLSGNPSGAGIQDAAPAPPAQPAPAAAPAAQGAKVMPATAVALGYQGAPAAPASPASAEPAASPAAPETPSPAQAEATASAPATSSQDTFDRTLSFSGNLALSVRTGAGNITLTKGSAGQVHIHGIVKAGKNADPAQVQQIVANPPIEQNGNAIRIGGQQQNLRDISISYEIEAPADTALDAGTGSGNIGDQGVGQNARLQTGSGNINATGLQGGFKTQTGSGNISIDGTGQGDAKAQTGSGTIDLKGVSGALEAQTGSGTIKADGKPSSGWKLQTGSGSIELAIGNASVNLDASVGSGRISADQTMTMQTSADKHHVHAQINGGGPEVRVETGSGNINIH